MDNHPHLIFETAKTFFSKTYSTFCTLIWDKESMKKNQTSYFFSWFQLIEFKMVLSVEAKMEID